MIISASRRTDIPAYYSQWFLNRITQGFVMVRNPIYPNQVRKISLNPNLIDCIVFWTKNPRNMFQHLDKLEPYHYYFLFTITPYENDLERHLPSKEKVIQTFINLSNQIGKERVVWRYDPILINDKYSFNFHLHQFDILSSKLQEFTNRCILSFLDMYKKCEKNLQGYNIKNINKNIQFQLAKKFHLVAKKKGIELFSCAEEIDLLPLGIKPGKCIDEEMIAQFTNYPLDVKKDRNQRKACQCVESIDIGAYNSCEHICLYCYANNNPISVEKNVKLHNPNSPLLIGELKPEDKIIECPIESFKKIQKNLF